MSTDFVSSETVAIRYVVSDISACMAFYTELLGFEIVMSVPPGFAILSKGNLRLLMNQPGAGGAGQSMRDGTTPTPGGWNRIQLQTTNIELAIDELKSKRARFR